MIKVGDKRVFETTDKAHKRMNGKVCVVKALFQWLYRRTYRKGAVVEFQSGKTLEVGLNELLPILAECETAMQRWKRTVSQ